MSVGLRKEDQTVEVAFRRTSSPLSSREAEVTPLDDVLEDQTVEPLPSARTRFPVGRRRSVPERSTEARVDQMTTGPPE